uniref:CWH43-like N-terminal domain-containing protein n=1 Tax=Romanomermis culicivorax TaxID=13658 RepID=A0A915IZL9_ROMCU
MSLQFVNNEKKQPPELKIMCSGCFGSSGSRGVGHVPVLLMILMVVTLLLTYVMAVYRRDVSPLFPYISDAGAKQPESSVFGLLLNFGAFLGIGNLHNFPAKTSIFCAFFPLGFLVIYLRYRLVAELNRGSDKILYRLNLGAFIIGVLSTLGMLIVGNFQNDAVVIKDFSEQSMPDSKKQHSSL